MDGGDWGRCCDAETEGSSVIRVRCFVNNYVRKWNPIFVFLIAFSIKVTQETPLSFVFYECLLRRPGMRGIGT